MTSVADLTEFVYMYIPSSLINIPVVHQMFNKKLPRVRNKTTFYYELLIACLKASMAKYLSCYSACGKIQLYFNVFLALSNSSVFVC